MTHVRRTADRSVTRWLQLGAGFRNGDVIDRMTMLAFWSALPSGVELDVDVSEGFTAEPSFLPDPHRFVTPAIAPVSGRSGVLAGMPSTVDAQGSDAMLREIGPQLEACSRAGIAVDAVGVAVDRPQSSASRDQLARLLAPIRSWSVRSSQCRDVLLELGVDRDRIVVGADWLWLYSPRERDTRWADEEWQRLGIDPSAPFVVVDDDGAGVKGAVRVAAALDRLSTTHGFQVALVASSSALEASPDRRASRLQAVMTRPAVVVESSRWTPDQWLALLNRATTALSRRYRFAIQAVLAETQLVPLAGSPNLAEIRADLDIAVLPEDFDLQSLVAAVTESDRARSIALLRNSRRQLEARAQNNLAWWPDQTRPADETRRRAETIERMCSMLWYHRIELMPGVVTPGQRWDELWDPIRRRHAEVDYQGKSVLEIGCWDGYWSFEAERLGAREIWATDDMSQRRSVTRTVPFAIETLGSRVRYRDDVSVYDVDECFGRTFDVVIFYGVLYHLRYPALAIAKLRRMLDVGGLLLLETAVLPEVDEPVMRWGYRAIYPDDPSSWNALSLPCLHEMLTSSYFEVEVCEAFLSYGHIGRGYARARAVDGALSAKHPVPDRFLADVARRPRRT